MAIATMNVTTTPTGDSNFGCSDVQSQKVINDG